MDYQIVVDILQFDGTRGGEAVLSARWRLVGGDEQTVFTTRKTHVTHHQASQDYEGLVEAMSHNLEDLSREIAESMKMLLPTNLPGSIS